MILYEMLYGFHPFGRCTSFSDLEIAVNSQTVDIPPQNTNNKNISESCLGLLRYLLQKDVDNRITWADFFNHPWIPEYISNNSNQNKSQQNNKQENLDGLTPPSPATPKSAGSTPGSTPNSKINIGASVVEIFDDYRGKPSDIEDSENNKQDNNNTDDLIFEMELDDKNKIIIKQVDYKKNLEDN